MPTNVHRYVGTRHSSRGSHEGRCPSIAPQRTVLLCLFLPSWPRMPECALTLRPQPWAGAVSPTYGPLPQPEGSMPLSRRPRAEWHRGIVENRRGGGTRGGAYAYRPVASDGVLVRKLTPRSITPERRNETVCVCDEPCVV